MKSRYILISLIVVLLVLLFFTVPFIRIVYFFLVPFLVILALGALILFLFSSATDPENNSPTPGNGFEGRVRKLFHGMKTPWITINNYIRKLILVTTGLIVLYIIVFLLFLNTLKRYYTREEMHEIADALNEYYKVQQKLPASLNELAGSNPLKANWKKDSWGNNYQYSPQNSNYILTSSGKDEKISTDDDIVLKH